MSDYVIAVSKDGKSASSETDPNSFIFHSSYNTFKIIKTGVKVCVLPAQPASQSFTVAHGLSFIPLVTAFAKAYNRSEAFSVNSLDITSVDTDLSIVYSTDVVFDKVTSDATNITFVFTNTGSDTIINVRYYCLEAI